MSSRINKIIQKKNTIGPPKITNPNKNSQIFFGKSSKNFLSKPKLRPYRLNVIKKYR